MGTRHLIAVVLNGEHRVAQSGQWDGYFSGQGKTVSRFVGKLAVPAVLEEFKSKVDSAKFATKEEFDKVFTKLGIETIDGEVNDNVISIDDSVYSYLSRNTGADILEVIMNWDDTIGPMMLIDQYSFASDGLFCEYAYVLDLDNKRLEVYTGFYTGPAPEGERFAHMNELVKEEKYGPVRLLATFDFEELALMTEDEFVDACEKAHKEARPEYYEEDAI